MLTYCPSIWLPEPRNKNLDNPMVWTRSSELQITKQCSIVEPNLYSRLWFPLFFLFCSLFCFSFILFLSFSSFRFFFYLLSVASPRGCKCISLIVHTGNPAPSPLHIVIVIYEGYRVHIYLCLYIFIWLVGGVLRARALVTVSPSKIQHPCSTWPDRHTCSASLYNTASRSRASCFVSA